MCIHNAQMNVAVWLQISMAGAPRPPRFFPTEFWDEGAWNTVFEETQDVCGERSPWNHCFDSATAKPGTSNPVTKISEIILKLLILKYFLKWSQLYVKISLETRWRISNILRNLWNIILYSSSSTDIRSPLPELLLLWTENMDHPLLYGGCQNVLPFFFPRKTFEGLPFFFPRETFEGRGRTMHLERAPTPLRSIGAYNMLSLNQTMQGSTPKTIRRRWQTTTADAMRRTWNW